VGLAQGACTRAHTPGARPGGERLCQGMRTRTRAPGNTWRGARLSGHGAGDAACASQGPPRQLDAALTRGTRLHIQPLDRARHRMLLSRARANPDPSPGARAHPLASSSSASFVSLASNSCAVRATRSSRLSGSAPGVGPGAPNRAAGPCPPCRPAGGHRGGCPGVSRAPACSRVGLVGPAVTACLLTLCTVKGRLCPTQPQAASAPEGAGPPSATRCRPGIPHPVAVLQCMPAARPQLQQQL